MSPSQSQSQAQPQEPESPSIYRHRYPPRTRPTRTQSQNQSPSQTTGQSQRQVPRQTRRRRSSSLSNPFGISVIPLDDLDGSDGDEPRPQSSVRPRPGIGSQLSSNSLSVISNRKLAQNQQALSAQINELGKVILAMRKELAELRHSAGAGAVVSELAETAEHGAIGIDVPRPEQDHGPGPGPL